MDLSVIKSMVGGTYYLDGKRAIIKEVRKVNNDLVTVVTDRGFFTDLSQRRLNNLIARFQPIKSNLMAIITDKPQLENLVIKSPKPLATNISKPKVSRKPRTYELIKQKFNEYMDTENQQSKELVVQNANSQAPQQIEEIQETQNQTSIELVVDRKTTAIIRNTLIDAMLKVSKDKDYIPQAEAISKNANTLIALQKSEIEALRLNKELNGKV